MSNEVKLQEGHPIDENLRPIKVGGESSALEISKDDVRVKNLFVSGDTTGVSASDDTKLPLAGGTMTGDIACASDLALDVEGDIVLDANDGDIKLKDNGVEFARFTSLNSMFILYENAGASDDDYFRIRCLENGETQIATVDNASDGADLNISVDGDITLNSKTGKFIAQNDSTEYSVAGSSYAGMILGYRCIGEDATPVTYTLTTSMVTIHADATVRFVAPPSGKVEVNFQAHYYGGNGATVTLGISDNATYSALSAPSAQYEKVSFDVSRFDDAILNQNWVITGLTAGTAYNYWIGAKTSSTSGTPTIKYGGDSAGENVPLIIKVTALPEASTHFAEYA